MEYEKVKKLSEEEFRRLTGVKPKVFEEMAVVLRDELDERHFRGGHRSRFSAEDQLLIMLEYWREYRTQFHMAQSRGVHEKTIWRIIRECEDVLARSRKFTLPGKKSLLKNGAQCEVVLIDATETPIERPKKSNGSGTRAKRNATH
jgi:hypothetical protein